MPRRAGIRRRKRTDLPPDWKTKAKNAIARAGGWCEHERLKGYPGVRCTKRATEVHHDHPRRMGGGHSATNLYALCGNCHDDVSSQPSAPPGW